MNSAKVVELVSGTAHAVAVFSCALSSEGGCTVAGSSPVAAAGGALVPSAASSSDTAGVAAGRMPLRWSQRCERRESSRTKASGHSLH